MAVCGAPSISGKVNSNLSPPEISTQLKLQRLETVFFPPHCVYRWEHAVYPSAPGGEAGGPDRAARKHYLAL